MLFLKHLVTLVAAAQDISNQIEDLIFLQHHEKHRWHGGYFGGLDAFNLLAVNSYTLVRVGEVGVDDDTRATEVDDDYGDGLAIVLVTTMGANWSLITLLGFMI